MVTEVWYEGSPKVKFMYNDRNHRVKKESYHNGSLLNSTFYVRDVTGQVMAIYNSNVSSSGSQGEAYRELVEQPIYGAGRIGVQYTNGLAVYELTDHLGNVRALFTKESATDSELEGYTDYYPFGMPMPWRKMQDADGYRYAFQGQEKDDETGKEAFELRLWDSRIGRWLTRDPAGQYASPYLGMGNNPMNGTDPDGGFWQEFKNWLGGNGWNSDAALDFEANGGKLGDWVGNRFSGYRVGYFQGDKASDSYGTAFNTIDDFNDYDLFDFEGTVAIGKAFKLSGDVGSNYIRYGYGGSITLTRMMFIGGDYGGYWYDYRGGEGGANFGMNLAAAPVEAQVSAEGEMIVGVYLGDESSPNPDTLEGLSGSLDISIDGDLVADLSLGGGVTISGPWLLFNTTIGVGLDTTPSVGLNGDFRFGTTTLLTPGVPTTDRTLKDMISNHLSFFIY